VEINNLTIRIWDSKFEEKDMSSYTIEEERSYEDKTADNVLQAALGAVSGLGGEVSKQENSHVEAKFDKKILGKVLGDRTQIEFDVSPAGEGAKVAVTIYPIDPVGRKLMFGARKGVAKTVLTWFWAHLEHRLG
jgi:hypothetical protein